MSIRKLTKPEQTDDIHDSMSDEEKEQLSRISEQIKGIAQSFQISLFANVPSPTSWGVSMAGQWFGYKSKKYQEPERDEQGTLYGYKVLIINLENGEFFSPVYPTPWSKEGTLEADREPDESNKHGIYCVKRIDDHELVEVNEWLTSKLRSPRPYSRFVVSVLVKLAVSGTVIEGETGFRGQHARIIGVLIDGHWQSYQEAYESARRYYIAQQAHRNETYWENEDYDEDYERYVKGNWNPLP